MAPPDIVDNAKHTSHAAGGRRTGWPMSVDDASTSILAPFLSNLPSMGAMGSRGISSLKGLLPLSPSPKRDATVLDEAFAAWQEGDLGDGRRRLLLLTTPTHALQIFAFRSGVIPDDQSAQEVFPAPEEVASLPDIVYSDSVQSTALPGVRPVKTPTDERAFAAHLLDKSLWGAHGPVVAMIASTAPSRAVQGQLALLLVSLKSGQVFRRLDLGSGLAASVTSSNRAVLLSTSHPSPSIHVLNNDLKAIHIPVSHLPVNPLSQLPISSVSGRLLAYATREVASIPGSEGFGSIVAASSARSRVMSAGAAPQSPPPTAQGALLSSAVEIGGGVARGVWSGLKMGARMAGERMAGDRLAQSAPTERADAIPHLGLSVTSGGPESRSVEEGMDGVIPRPAGGTWVKIVDLFPRLGDGNGEPDLIAHFKLPPSRSLVSPIPAQNMSTTSHREYPIALLAFSPEGSRLFAAASDGRDFHVLDVRPRGGGFPHRPGGPRGEVWDTYILRRGNTAATVQSVSWSQDERWISVGTGKGTVHVFPISPAGGKPTAASHTRVKIANPSQLQPLSIEVTPFARLRPTRPGSSEDLVNKADEAKLSAFATAVFVKSRRSPLSKNALCQDVAVYRSGNTQLELARLTAHAKDAVTRITDTPPSRRGSNLTAMMREKAGLAPEGDLAVEEGLKARWAMPLGQGATESPVVVAVRTTKRTAKLAKPARSLYHAEIQTHTSSSRVLPASIYLSRQVDFFAAVPTDDYSPLSVLDKVARTRRLVFRPEVEIHPPNTDARSFDEPLNSALHSVMESRLAPQFPTLPNGSPSKGSPFWSSIPIRHVAAGLGEGVDRVRREYVRAAHQRQMRRSSNAAQNAIGVSFEDDAVHPPRRSSDESEDVESSPSSLLPTSTQGDDDGWGELWEDEYNRAVEDDGPDDLVLGLLDEEEEERRKWEHRQKALAKEYQK